MALAREIETGELAGKRVLCAGDKSDLEVVLNLLGEEIETLHLLAGCAGPRADGRPSIDGNVELTQQLKRSGWTPMDPGVAAGTDAEETAKVESTWQQRGRDPKLRVVMDPRCLGLALDETDGPLAVFVGGRGTWQDETWSRWPGFYRVLDRLMDGGLLIVRGPGTCPRGGQVHRRHRPLFDAGDYAKRHGWDGLIGVEFRNGLGLRFRCIDCVGEADERHVIWQVRRT